MAYLTMVIAVAVAVLVAFFLYRGRRQQPQRKPFTGQEKKEQQKEYFHHQYGTDRIVVMVRDPEWLHAYWEITPSKREEFSRQFGTEWPQARPTLRIYDTTPDNESQFDIPIDDTADNWYICVGRPNHSFFVDLGRLLPDGRFVTIARSNRVTTPSNWFSSEIDPNWVPNEAIWGLFGEDYVCDVSSHEMFVKRQGGDE